MGLAGLPRRSGVAVRVGTGVGASRTRCSGKIAVGTEGLGEIEPEHPLRKRIADKIPRIERVTSRMAGFYLISGRQSALGFVLKSRPMR